MLPEHYALEQRPGQWAIALAEEREAVWAALLEEKGCVAMPDTGRAAVSCFPLRSGEGIRRSYRRGGLVGKVFHDQFLGNRMRREFDVSLAYYQLGGSIPEPLGVCWRRTWGIYRGAYAARRVEGVTLLAYLQEGAHSSEGVLEAVGQMVRHLHDAGFWHADLQVKNILVAQGKPCLIDFDKAQRYSKLGRIPRSRNLLRLRRSFEKQGLSLDNFASLLHGYGDIVIPGWLQGLYRLRGVSAGLRGAP